MIKFTNGLILNEAFEVTNDKVYVDGNRITAVTQQDLPADTVYDLGGNLLMTGFKNAHTHSAMTFARSFADDLPLQPWLFDMIFPMEAKLTGEDIYTLSQLAFMEYLTSGITACFDMYYFPEEFARASVDFGFRSVLTCGLNNFKENLTLLEEYYNRYNNYHDLISYKLGFHAEYTTAREILEGVGRLADKYQAPVFMHSSETEHEVKECIERYGKTPTALFDELGLFNYGGGGYHSVWLNDEDIEIYRNKGVWAIINAASNAKLASGIAPVEQLSKCGINLAIGTDGPSSNNALDMFREMFLVSATQKLLNKAAASMDANEILKMATVGSAQCMGLDDAASIAVGSLADLTVIDMHKPNMQPINNITKNLVYSGSKDNVIMTMINGKILYENGEFVGVDKEKIYFNAQKIIDRIGKD